MTKNLIPTIDISPLVNQDLYFRTKDNEFEKKFIPNVSLRPFNSPYGHCAAKSWQRQRF